MRVLFIAYSMFTFLFASCFLNSFHPYKLFSCLQMHIQTLRGRVLETILSLRFIMFQYGIVYKLHLTGKNTSIAVCFLSF